MHPLWYRGLGLGQGWSPSFGPRAGSTWGCNPFLKCWSPPPPPPPQHVYFWFPFCPIKLNSTVWAFQKCLNKPLVRDGSIDYCTCGIRMNLIIFAQFYSFSARTFPVFLLRAFQYFNKVWWIFYESFYSFYIDKRKFVKLIFLSFKLFWKETVPLYSVWNRTNQVSSGAMMWYPMSTGSAHLDYSTPLVSVEEVQHFFCTHHAPFSTSCFSSVIKSCDHWRKLAKVRGLIHQGSEHSHDTFFVPLLIGFYQLHYKLKFIFLKYRHTLLNITQSILKVHIKSLQIVATCQKAKGH